MGRLNWRKIGSLTVCALPVAVAAQVPTTPTQEPPTPENIVGGTPTVDLITIKQLAPGVPLRFGNIVPGSERVSLDAMVLKRGEDYSVDHAAGVIYLRRAVKVGQTVTVSYRYDKAAPVPPSKQYAGLGTFQYSLAPGALNVMMGLGMTERTADGNVISSNLFGLNNNFRVGQGSLKGLMLVGERQKVDAESLYETEGQKSAVEEGSSKFILQNLNTKFMGGSVSIDYQDISKNFAGWSSAEAAGYNSQQVGQLQKEKGLRRFGIGLSNLNFNGTKFSSNYKTVGDGENGIEWQSFGFARGDVDKGNGLLVNWSSQKVDKGFTRFKDLAEGDREQLLKEAGLERQSIVAKFALSAGKISYFSNRIQDSDTGDGIERREFALNVSKLGFEFGDQEVDAGFTRAPHLRPEENAAYGREVGLKRQWMRMSADLFGGKTQPIKFSQSIIDSPGGSFKAVDGSVGGKGWSFEHITRSIDSGFNGYSPLNATKEGDENIAAIARMYGPNVQYNLGNERNWLLRSSGIEREFNRFSAQVARGVKFDAANLELDGKLGGGSLQTFSLIGTNFDVNVRKLSISDQFSELMTLMDLERQRLGTIVGLDRLDVGLNFNLNGKKLTASQMTADTEAGGASRTNVIYTDKKLHVEMNSREVDPNFHNVNQLVDPEKDLLNSLKGFNERDIKVRWELWNTLKLDFFDLEADNDLTNEERRFQQTFLNWNPNKDTELSYAKVVNNSTDPLSVLFANTTERLNVTKKLGKLGTLRYMNERQDFDGRSTNLVDFNKQYFGLETKLNDKTSVRAEQTRTSYENGDKENVSANTVTTSLTKNMGVSVTDYKVDRTGDQRDEAKQNYGFWYDFGSGFRLAYGMMRSLIGEESYATSSLNIGKNANQSEADKIGSETGQIGNMVIGGGYGERAWEGQNDRSQSFSKLTLGNAKPFRFGFLSDVKVNFGMDTAADYSKWIRENKTFGLSAKIGSNQLSYGYLGQMFTNGYRAIDRTFAFQTDQSDKRMITASLFYKVRTLPWDEEVMIRNFNITARPSKNLTIKHSMLTNPEIAKPDALLGTLPQAHRTNEWRIDYKQDGNLTFGGVWTEYLNDQTSQLKRTAGVNIMLFEKSGSPLKLFYGMEEVGGNVKRQLLQRYSLQFDQKAGPNQAFSFFIGNLTYNYDIAQGFKKDNWTVRLDYQFRF